MKKKATIIIGVLIVVILIVFTSKEITNKDVKGVSENNSPSPTSELTSPSADLNVVVNPSDSKEPTITQTPTPSPTPTPTPTSVDTVGSKADYDEKVDNSTWNFVDNMLKKIDELQTNPTVNQRLVSNGGYYYNINVPGKVTNKMILGRNIKDPEFTTHNIDAGSFLYIYPQDLKKFNNLRISNSKELEVFYAYKTKEGYAISSDKSSGGVIGLDDLDNIIKKYSEKHGTITAYNPKSADYNDLKYQALIAIGKSGVTELDTRYCYGDGNYAVLVTSPRGYSKEVHGFIFDKKDGNWEIAVKDFQKIPSYSKAINTQFPYMNTDLMPRFDLNAHADEYIDTLDPIVTGMKVAGQITDSDLPLLYGVGVANEFYFEFTSGKAFIGIRNSQNGVTSYEVKTVEEAKKIMKDNNPQPPYIILKQY